MMDVRGKVREFLGGFLRNHHIGDDEDIFATGFANSLFVMQLVMLVERDFEVEVADDDLDFANFRSVTAIVEFVARKQALKLTAVAGQDGPT
jgi:methoxymalonate biosynthesis acyl carrier protein